MQLPAKRAGMTVLLVPAAAVVAAADETTSGWSFVCLWTTRG